MVGDIPITLMHTPGHTPGSQCFLVDGRLVAGDTLFLEGCGRTDLPGADPDAMYESLTQRLATVPDDTVLYPGHLYSPEPSATMGETRRSNYVFRIPQPRPVAHAHGRREQAPRGRSPRRPDRLARRGVPSSCELLAELAARYGGPDPDEPVADRTSRRPPAASSSPGSAASPVGCGGVAGAHAGRR